MGIIKKILQYILIAIIATCVIKLISFSIKKENDINKKCNFVIIDSRGYQYHAVDYMVLENDCLKLVDNEYKNIIICGPHVIKQLR
jgi:hypothetical protein